MKFVQQIGTLALFSSSSALLSLRRNLQAHTHTHTIPIYTMHLWTLLQLFCHVDFLLGLTLKKWGYHIYSSVCMAASNTKPVQSHRRVNNNKKLYWYDWNHRGSKFKLMQVGTVEARLRPSLWLCARCLSCSDALVLHEVRDALSVCANISLQILHLHIA